MDIFTHPHTSWPESAKLKYVRGIDFGALTIKGGGVSIWSMTLIDDVKGERKNFDIVINNLNM